MPKRTDDERKLIDSLPVKEPDKYCNARTPRGYCKRRAGHGTHHLGDGRCKFHGGASVSIIRTANHLQYSKVLTSTVVDELQKIISNPHFMSLNEELGVLKVSLSNILSSISVKLETENPFISLNRHGEEIVSPEFEVLNKLINSINRTIKTINDIEVKQRHSLTLRQVGVILQQIKIAMNQTCGACPVRDTMALRINKVKISPIKEED